MKLDKDNFYVSVDSFIALPGEVADISSESFSRVYESVEARQHKDIVYLLRTARNFPRLKGESSILYIGQTKYSYTVRHSPTIKWVTKTEANLIKYGWAIENYGPLYVSVHNFNKFGESPAKAEAQLLWWYFQNHCEYPPFNYTKTKCRNNVVVI